LGAYRTTGIPWEDLPVEMGGGFGNGLLASARDWQTAGGRDRLRQTQLDEWGAAGQVDWRRESVGRTSIPPNKGVMPRAESDRLRQTGHETAPDRRSAWDAPLPLLLTGADRHDSTVLEPRLGAAPPTRTLRASSGNGP